MDDTLEVTDEVTLTEPCGTPLLDLKANQCRYPTGFDGMTLFCGEPRRDATSSFCSHHHTIVWVKPRKIW